MATQQYLRRYDLDLSATDVSEMESSAPHLLDPTPASNLKSILRRVTETSETNNEKPTNNDQEMSLQVLDIARLKELPKLL